MRYLFLLISLILLSPKATAQTERSDSMSLSPFYQTPSDTLPRELMLDTSVRYKAKSDFSLSDWSAKKDINLNLPKLNNDFYLGRATVASWNNGLIYFSGGTQTMPGLMAVESGRINLGQEFGRFSFNFYGEAAKYAWFRGLHTSYGFGADVTYRFNDRVSATIFASYFTPVSPAMMMNPALAGYTAVPNFGGYFDFSISDKFGVQVGAQSYRSVLSRRWEAQPIVKPYYKISEKASIGIDVGGILYNVLKSNVGNKSWGNNNPTIGPPVKKLSEMMGY